MIRLPKPIAFEWDDGNRDKNWIKHGISNTDAEACFFDRHKRLAKDKKHTSRREARYILLGQTQQGHVLFIAFTIREQKVRIISARDATLKEWKLYEKRT